MNAALEGMTGAGHALNADLNIAVAFSPRAAPPGASPPNTGDPEAIAVGPTLEGRRVLNDAARARRGDGPLDGLHDPDDRGPGRFPLGDFPLDSGGVLPDAVLTWRWYGALSASRDNAILLPSYYTGTSNSYEAMIGRDRALDPGRWFIIAVDMFGNGRASSPSHAGTPRARAAFPRLSVADNIRAQARLLEQLGVRRLALVHGWSMGAIQAWYWAAMFPDMVSAILPVCGAARCWPQNRAFLEGMRAILTSDANWSGGAYTSAPSAALRAFGRAYASWAFSAEFFRERLYTAKGHASLEALLQSWEEDHLVWEAADLVAMLDTWASADIGTLGDDWQEVLRGIRARTIVMPCDTDRYFMAEENQIEANLVPNCELRLIRSPYGHRAGAPGRCPQETAAIEAAINDLLRHRP